MKNVISISCVLITILAAASCGKESPPHAPDQASSTSPATTEPELTAADVVGLWKVTSLTGLTRATSPALYDGLISTEIVFRADHLAHLYDERAFGHWCPWTISGNVITLEDRGAYGDERLVATHYKIQGGRIIVHSINMEQILERQSDPPIEGRFSAGEYVAMNADQSQITAKWRKKMVVIEGVVAQIDDADPAIYLFDAVPDVKTNSPRTTLVRCLTIDRRPYMKVSLGQKVKILGRAFEGDPSPVLRDAEVIEAGPSAAVRVAATALAADISAGVDAANEKYRFLGDQGLLLTLSGDVFSCTTGPGKPSVLTLGNKDAKIDCSFFSGNAHREKPEDYKPGDAVTVYGIYTISPTPQIRAFHIERSTK